MSPEMWFWSWCVIGVTGVVVYLYIGVVLLNQVWWAFGEPPKTRWKYRWYQVKMLSIVVGYPIWAVFLGIRYLFQKDEIQ